MNKRMKKKRKKRLISKNFDRMIYQAFDEINREKSNQEFSLAHFSEEHERKMKELFTKK